MAVSASVFLYFPPQKPAIVDFEPKKGPIAGGTLVNMTIDHFTDREIYILKIAELDVDKATLKT